MIHDTHNTFIFYVDFKKIKIEIICIGLTNRNGSVIPEAWQAGKPLLYLPRHVSSLLV
jgi:hypothetical protein